MGEGRGQFSVPQAGYYLPVRVLVEMEVGDHCPVYTFHMYIYVVVPYQTQTFIILLQNVKEYSIGRGPLHTFDMLSPSLPHSFYTTFLNFLLFFLRYCINTKRAFLS
jgi:hypothetical protein